MPDNKFLENSLRSSKTPALLHVATRIGDVALNRFVEGISRIKRIPPPCRISYVYSCLYILYFLFEFSSCCPLSVSRLI